MQTELKKYEDKMHKAIHALEEEYNTIRAGRANPHVLDRIMVDYYGQPTPIQQVGNISVPEAHLLQIQPWDASVLKDLEKAILASELGITPQNDGKLIRLNFPALTEEKRKELTKEIKSKGEDAKVAIRNIRRDANDNFKKAEKANEITEDDLKDLETEVQKLTDKFIKDIDVHVADKQADIMKV